MDADPERRAGSDGTKAGEPLRGTVDEDAGGWSRRYHRDAARPEWVAWTWASRSGSFSWLGALLVVVGLALLVEQLVPELGLFSLLLAALGLAFAAAWLFGRIVAATVPALVLLAWAAARMAVELGYLSGGGWTALFVGIALLAAWALGRLQGARRGWAAVLGAILVIIGLADAMDGLPWSIDLAVLVPVVVIGLGILLIVGRRPMSRTD